MKHSIQLILIISFTFLFSCKKDKLKEDTAILEGKWKWISTKEIQLVWPFNSIWHNTTTEGKYFSLEFTRTGKIYQYENNVKNGHCYRIVFDEIFYDQTSTVIGYSILPNNKRKNDFSISLYHTPIDSIVVSGFFPFTTSEDNEEKLYHNCFIREN